MARAALRLASSWAQALSTTCPWMIEGRGHHLDTWPGRQNGAGFKIVEFDLALRGFDLDRKQRIAHQLPDGLLYAASRFQVTGPQPQPVTLHKRGHEKRQTDQMIYMAVT